MRIISGDQGGRRIASPPEKAPTRPMTDRVKEALFNRLMSAGLLGEGAVLDVFAGTGGLGLEALSRGAEHCTFVEAHPHARRLLEKNTADLGHDEETALVLGVDALAGNWLHLAGPDPETAFRVIFCDPPYPMTESPEEMARLVGLLGAMRARIDPEGLMVLRTRAKGGPAAPSPPGWEGPESRRYKSMVLHYYAPAEDAQEAAR
jgi:16S rRNA (guanine966-N2)-methyltransferase